jgi:drug/metabolite transporter (DMT)-like permease
MSVIWGVPYLMIRVAVRDLSPGTLVFARTFPATLLLLPLALHRGALTPVLRQWKVVAVYTAVELGIPWLLLARSEQHLSSSLTSLLVATVPSVGLLANRATGQAEHLDRRRLAGLVLGLAGVSVLVGIDVHGASVTAAAEMAVVVVGYAVGPILINRRLSGLPDVGVVTVSLGMAALVYAPWAVSHPPRHLTASVVASVAGLVVICTALAFILFFQLIAEIGPSRATVITYINPAVAVLLGVVVLGEPFGLGIAVGFPLVLVGSVLATAPAGGGALGPGGGIVEAPAP